MPTLVELFKNKTITDGPNAGKTAEKAYEVQNSKDVLVQTSNSFLRPSVNFINKRRKDGIRLGETRIEEETTGLRALTDNAKFVLYGGDSFRIINGTTRTMRAMLRNSDKSGAGLDDSITDKIGSALSRFTGDAVSNLLSKGETPRPRLDTAALGASIGLDIVDRTLGKLLPDPLIPSKVVEEYQKGYRKKEQYFLNEFDIEKRNQKLISKKGLGKLVDSLLKDNKDIMNQTKDFAISKAASLAGGLVSAGISKLSDSIFDKSKNTKVGNDRTAQPSYLNTFVYSNQKPYSKSKNIFEDNVVDRNDLSSKLILARQANFARLFKKTGNSSLPDDSETFKNLSKEPVSYSTYERPAKLDKRTKRGITSTGDALTMTPYVSYAGHTATLEDGTTMDDLDFIPLKFYSIANDTTIQFRCTITELSETFSPQWDTNKFIGNPFPFYTYQSIDRSLNFSFKIFSMNLMEHQLVWERINDLAGMVYPQRYSGVVGAVTPPIIKFTLGNMYFRKECFIETLTFSVDENTPWEIGLNEKLLEPITPQFPLGFATKTTTDIKSEGFKLPMIINADVTLKFIEGRNNTSPTQNLYGFEVVPTRNQIKK